MNSIKFIRGYKVRIYPNKEQEILLWKHIGACRFIWNLMLDINKEHFTSTNKPLYAYDMMNLLPGIKKDSRYRWLKEISSVTQQKVCKDLGEAFTRLRNGVSRFPKYKTKKRSKPSYPVDSGKKAFYFENGYVTVAKIGKIRYKTDYSVPLGVGNRFFNARIKNVCNKWILSFSAESENQAQVLNNQPVGIDLGLRKLATISFGDKSFVFKNINDSYAMKELERKEKRLQKDLSRSFHTIMRRSENRHTSKNAMRIITKLKKIYHRKASIRLNYIHHITNFVVSLRPSCVVMEDLAIGELMKNRFQSKRIQDACWYTLIRQMKYKCEWNGIEFTQVDRYYPSSKICSNCGCINTNLGSNEIYICPDCGAVIDRDINASRNLMNCAQVVSS